MKNSFEFLKFEIDYITENFSYTKCLYEHDIRFSTHYIKILPLIEFESNERLNGHLDEVFFDFINKFPDESITFISEDQFITLSDVVYESCGKKYAEKTSTLTVNFPILDIYSELKIKDDPSFEDNFEYDFSLAA